MKLYARVTMNRDYPPRPRPGILHLQNIRSVGVDQTEVNDAGQLKTFIAARPEIGHVLVYDSRFPQRGRSLEDFFAKDLHKLWK